MHNSDSLSLITKAKGSWLELKKLVRTIPFFIVSCSNLLFIMFFTVGPYVTYIAPRVFLLKFLVLAVWLIERFTLSYKAVETLKYMLLIVPFHDGCSNDSMRKWRRLERAHTVSYTRPGIASLMKLLLWKKYGWSKKMKVFQAPPFEKFHSWKKCTMATSFGTISARLDFRICDMLLFCHRRLSSYYQGSAYS